MVSLNAGASIVSFTASADQVFVGQTVELSWEVENARDGIRITSGGETVATSTAARGSVEVTPEVAGEADYELTALSPNGDAQLALAFLVEHPPPVVEGFTVSANPAGIGSTVTLRWVVRNALRVRVTQVPEPNSGSLSAAATAASAATATA